MVPAGAHLGPRLDEGSGQVVFRLPHDLGATPQRVWFHLRDFGADPTFHREADAWVARIPRPPVARMEYLVVLRWPDGGESMVPDPANPRRARGVFGDHSVVEFPGYATPWWITVSDAAEAQARRDAQARVSIARRAALLTYTRGEPWRHQPAGPRARQPDLVAVAGPHDPAELLAPSLSSGEGVGSVRARGPAPGSDDRALRAPSWRRVDPAPGARGPVASGEAGVLRGALVADAGRDPEPVVDGEAAVAVVGQLHVPSDSTPAEPLPLLVVHDGPEYADLAQLLRYLSTLARIEPGLRCRVLLLAPVDRDRSYSASPAYARALATRMLPSVARALPTRGPVAGLGASLGGLAMLHVAASHPGTLGGVLSQSGSFFRPRTDGMEQGYRFYDRIVRFVDGLGADPARLAGLRVSLTCGTGEENLANNRAMARRLARMEVACELVENPDGHNYTGWRDALDPSLRRLLQALWT